MKKIALLVVFGMSLGSTVMADSQLGQQSMSRVSAGASFCGNSSKDKVVLVSKSASATSEKSSSRSGIAR